MTRSSSTGARVRSLWFVVFGAALCATGSARADHAEPLMFAQNCSQGPNYNNCMNEYRQELREQQQERQEQQQRLQEQREEQQRAQQQRQEEQQQRAQQQQEQQQRAQQQQQQEQQRAQQQRQQQEQQQRAQQQQQEQQRAQQQRQQQQQQEQQRTQQQRQQQQQQDQQRAQQQEQQRTQQQRQQQQQQDQQRAQQQRQQQQEQQHTQQQQHQQPEQQRVQQQRQQPEQQRVQQQQPQQQRPSERASAQPVAPNRATNQNAPSPGVARAQPPAQQAHPVRINPTTTVVARPNHGGIVITQHRPNGAEVVVRRTVASNGRPAVVAYQQRVDPTTHAQTRVFLDGHRVTVARDSVTFSAPRHLTVTAHRDGLHDAFLPDGRRFYHEAFATEHGARVLQRTVFATIAAGTVVALGVPLVETFGVVPYHGVVIYPYYPVVYDPVFYPFFVSPFATPVVVGPACAFCPPPVVAFAQPMQAYSDPTDLMTDMQIADAMQDGEDQLPPPSSPPPPDADVQALQDQVASLQQEVDVQAQTNDELQAALQQQGDQNAALQSQVASQQQQSVPPAPIPVAADVRQQIKKEVKDDIALHQQKKPLSVPEIAASADAQNYIFQVSDILDATTDSGEECALTGGDLVKFDQVPGDNDLAAAMKVVTSKPGSCQAGSVIQASVADLQDMLNGFSERLDANMKKVHDQYASTSNSGKTVTP